MSTTSPQQDDSTSTATTTRSNQLLSSFPQFSDIHDEGIKRLIISFLAEAPYERNIINEQKLRHEREGGRMTTLSRYTAASNNTNDDSGTNLNHPGVSSLTSTLPLVNKEFNRLSNLDEYWEAALLRQANISHNDDFHLWIQGLHRLLPDNYNYTITSSGLSLSQQQQQQQRNGHDDGNNDQTHNSHAAYYPYHNNDQNSLEKQHRNMIHAIRYPQQQQQSNNENNENLTPCCSCKQIYLSIIKYHIQFVGPIFVMPCQIRIGEIYGLHLFEPRYRLLVSDLINNCCENPQQVRNGGGGGPIIPRRMNLDFENTTNTNGTNLSMKFPPYFIHAYRGPRLGTGEIACLVELVACRIYEHGTADVQLKPISWVQLDTIWVRPSSGHLFYAKANRL